MVFDDFCYLSLVSGVEECRERTVTTVEAPATSLVNALMERRADAATTAMNPATSPVIAPLPAAEVEDVKVEDAKVDTVVEDPNATTVEASATSLVNANNRVRLSLYCFVF